MIMGLRVFAGAVGLLVLAYVSWALFADHDLHGTFWQQVGVIWTLPWGKTAIIDLYAGYMLFALIILMVESTWLAAGLWIAPIFLLGNVWPAVWLVVRMPLLVRRLTRPDA